MTQQLIQESGLKPEDRICPVNAATLYELVIRYTDKADKELSPHEFRKWCATFWDRNGEPKMAAFVLRHKGGIKDPDDKDKLYGIYVAGLAAEDAIEKTKAMEEGLYGKTAD